MYNRLFLLLLFLPFLPLRAETNLLANPRFLDQNERSVPKGWFVDGKTIVSVQDGAATLSLPADRGKQWQATIMQHLLGRVREGHSYLFSVEAIAPRKTTGMLYIEGHSVIGGEKKYFCTKDIRFDVDEHGTTRTIAFTVPATMERIYLAMRTTAPDIPITYKNPKLLEKKEESTAVGIPAWRNRPPESPRNGLLLPAGQSAIWCNLPIQAGRTYRLSFQVAGQGATGVEGYDLFDYRLSARPIFAGGLAFRSATQDAQRHSLVVTVPKESKSTTLDLTFASLTFGTLLFTDLSFVESQRDPTEGWAFLFTEPCYRDTIHARTDTGFLAGEILAGPSAASAEITIKGLPPIRVLLSEGHGTFRARADQLAIGAYPVLCQVRDAQGKTLWQRKRLLRKVPPAEHEVLVDSHRALLVDGKPFVPIIEYRTRTGFLKGGFYHMARHGINTVMLVNLPANEARTLAILDQLHALGMKGIIETWSASDMAPASRNRFAQRFHAAITPAVRRHPALLAYFTNDEPFACGRNPAPIEWTAQFLQETDPYHPVWVGQSPRDVALVNLRPYADGSDITGIDIYPLPSPHPHCDLPDKSINCVGAYTRIIDEVVYHRKPVWMTIQAFEWHDHNFPASTLRRVYPTEDETRFMAFDALFNGSRATVLYGTPTIKSLPYRKLLYRLTEELREVSGLTAAGEAMEDAPHETPNVRMARRRVGEKIYYGIFNQEPKEKTHTFAAAKPLLIYREGRRLVPQNGKITVRLRPHEVIVCGESPLPPPCQARPPCQAELEDTPDPALALIRSKNGIGEDPFASQHYQGKANWIWNRGQEKVASSSCVLMKRFTLEKVPGNATLRFCADDEADAFLNGHFVGNGDGHGRLHEYRVGEFLRQGENLLLINARDGGGLPCAMLADLQADDTTVAATDASWQGRATTAGEDFTATSQTLPTQPALIVAPNGQGPWQSPLLPGGN